MSGFEGSQAVLAHPSDVDSVGVLIILPRHGPRTQHHLQELLYCCCDLSPIDGPAIVDMFTGRCLATDVFPGSVIPL
jgi:hypothetical protein